MLSFLLASPTAFPSYYGVNPNPNPNLHPTSLPLAGSSKNKGDAQKMHDECKAEFVSAFTQVGTHEGVTLIQESANEFLMYGTGKKCVPLSPPPSLSHPPSLSLCLPTPSCFADASNNILVVNRGRVVSDRSSLVAGFARNQQTQALSGLQDTLLPPPPPPYRLAPRPIKGTADACQ
jgi:hypothetical protein